MPTLEAALFTHLASYGIGTPGVTLYRKTTPATPVNCVVVSGTGGFHDLGNKIQAPTAQIMIRHEHHSSCNSWFTQVCSALGNGEMWFGPNSGLHGRLAYTSEAGAFVTDMNGRIVYIINVVLNAIK